METITSTTNQFVKLARSLKEKKFRDSAGLFLVEGANILRDMPLSESVQFFLVDEFKQYEYENITANFSCPTYTVANKIFDSVCDTKTPQGIVAVVAKKKSSFTLAKTNALLLDKVSDAGNLGTILRTAAAAGFTTIYLLECADVFSPKVVRASMGGIFKVNSFVVSESEAINVVKNTQSIALDMSGKPLNEFESLKNVYNDANNAGFENKSQHDNACNITLIGGSEAHGVRESIKNCAKEMVSIPMKNQMESLNVAVALAIVMYKTI